jgi:serine/threonine protein phosphatase PrpC
MIAQLDFASLSDTGRRRLANEDAHHCDAQMGLFVLCDGIGGQPSGEAASQIIVHTLGYLVRQLLRDLGHLDEPAVRTLLNDVTMQISKNLYTHCQNVAALNGMGATLVTAMFVGSDVYLLHVGDSRAYLLREGELSQVTEDHTRSYREPSNPQMLSDQQTELNERRLLTQYVGSKQAVRPHIERLAVQPGDRLLLCSDGLTDPVDDDRIHRLLTEHSQPSQACAALVHAANSDGGPDNITAVVIDYKGVGPAPAESLSPPASDTAAPSGAASSFYDALGKLEKDLAWLQAGAQESAQTSVISAFAAIKRRLGVDVYREFLEMHPSKNPAHVFHRACTMPDSDWRKTYQEHMRHIEPITAKITDGSVRLSPVLTSDETSRIMKTLWQDWRRVEKRYMATCQRDAIDEDEQTLDVLIDHMLKSVKTLEGLLEFFPRFMR